MKTNIILENYSFNERTVRIKGEDVYLFEVLNSSEYKRTKNDAAEISKEIVSRYNQYPDIMRENQELKARCETYKKDYESMVAEVLRLSRENSKMREMVGERIKELEK